jgi:hypothetical protein
MFPEVPMPETIPNLWGEQVKVDVVTPLAVLRTQANVLKRITQGLLEVNIETTSSQDQVIHHFFLVAPALNRYSELLFTVEHAKNKVYPVMVRADCLSLSECLLLGIVLVDDSTCVAKTQDEFLTALQTILRSGDVQSSIQSLIARSNEAVSVKTAPAPA